MIGRDDDEVARERPDALKECRLKQWIGLRAEENHFSKLQRFSFNILFVVMSHERCNIRVLVCERPSSPIVDNIEVYAA